MSARVRSALLLALAGLACQPGAAAEKEKDSAIYHYKQGNGVRVYTDRKPDNVAYIEISKYGRPVATASCTGLTPQALESRGNLYSALIAKYATEHQVKPGLVRAVMRVESCFDRKAVSRVGARGLMQLMPGTASDLGVSDSFNAEQNISGGVRYLRMMLDRFEQKTDLALAAYNAGPEAVNKHKGIPPFKETREYVRKVLDIYSKHSGLRYDTETRTITDR